MPSDHELQSIAAAEAKRCIEAGYTLEYERDAYGAILCWVVSPDRRRVCCCRRRDFVDLLYFQHQRQKMREKAIAGGQP